MEENSLNFSDITERIKEVITGHNMTPKAFAEKVGISIAYTGMIERGEKIPKLETFIRIANVLEVSADLLLADVIKAQPFSDTSARAEVVNSLSKESRERIYDVIDTLLRHEKR